MARNTALAEAIGYVEGESTQGSAAAAVESAAAPGESGEEEGGEGCAEGDHECRSSSETYTAPPSKKDKVLTIEEQVLARQRGKRGRGSLKQLGEFDRC